jgi:hypothetical protein
MLDIEETAKKNGKDAAQNYFLLANGFYNMTYYGNARVFRATRIYWDTFSWSYDPQENNMPSEIETMYYDCSRAKTYYAKALELAPNKEFAAKCQWMMLKCDLNTYYNEGVGSDGDYPNTLIHEGFYDSLITVYGKTKYYQEIIAQCGYIREYAARTEK